MTEPKDKIEKAAMAIMESTSLPASVAILNDFRNSALEDIAQLCEGKAQKSTECTMLSLAYSDLAAEIRKLKEGE
jgi:hypothetical protein